MGLFNVLKLANDYSKAKKFIEKIRNNYEDKLISIEEAKKLLDKLGAFAKYLKDLKGELNQLITRVADYIVEIKELLEKVKEAK